MKTKLKYYYTGIFKSKPVIKTVGMETLCEKACKFLQEQGYTAYPGGEIGTIVVKEVFEGFGDRIPYESDEWESHVLCYLEHFIARTHQKVYTPFWPSVTKVGRIEILPILEYED